MNKTLRKRFEKAGWKVGSADDFLGLSEVESADVQGLVRKWMTAGAPATRARRPKARTRPALRCPQYVQHAHVPQPPPSTRLVDRCRRDCLPSRRPPDGEEGAGYRGTHRPPAPWKGLGKLLEEERVLAGPLGGGRDWIRRDCTGLHILARIRTLGESRSRAEGGRFESGFPLRFTDRKLLGFERHET